MSHGMIDFPLYLHVQGMQKKKKKKKIKKNKKKMLPKDASNFLSEQDSAAKECKAIFTELSPPKSYLFLLKLTSITPTHTLLRGTAPDVGLHVLFRPFVSNM